MTATRPTDTTHRTFILEAKHGDLRITVVSSTKITIYARRGKKFTTPVGVERECRPYTIRGVEYDLRAEALLVGGSWCVNQHFHALWFRRDEAMSRAASEPAKDAMLADVHAALRAWVKKHPGELNTADWINHARTVAETADRVKNLRRELEAAITAQNQAFGLMLDYEDAIKSNTGAICLEPVTVS